MEEFLEMEGGVGFSEKDYRDLTPPEVERTVQPSPSVTLDVFTANTEVIIPAVDAADTLNVKEQVITAIYYPEITSSGEHFVNELTQQATVQNKDYAAQAEAAVNADIPAALENKMNKHKLMSYFYFKLDETKKESLEIYKFAVKFGLALSIAIMKGF